MRIGTCIAIAVGLLASTAAASPDVPGALHRYYGSRAGYLEVSRDVLGWHHTRLNGCVAFASTALRHVGVAIPRDAKIDGQGVSRITRSFSLYLETELHWQRITAMAALRPGDIVFSTDAPCCPGYPDHVIVFDGWRDRTRAIANVIDNQGFRIARPMIQAAGSDVDGFAYALRPAT
jgi:hypothetical protein